MMNKASQCDLAGFDITHFQRSFFRTHKKIKIRFLYPFIPKSYKVQATAGDHYIISNDALHDFVSELFVFLPAEFLPVPIHQPVHQGKVGFTETKNTQWILGSLPLPVHGPCIWK